MTVHEKSEAQLDAEAAPLSLRELDAMVEQHRGMYRDDNRIPRLVSRQPPLTRYQKGDDDEEGERERTGANQEYTYESGARTGMPMSGAMIRRLSEYPGELYPWVTAFSHLRTFCRRFHPQHRRSDRRYWRGSLCWSMVSLTVVQNWTPEKAAQIMAIDSPEPVLSQALRHISETIDNYRARAEKRAREDEGLGSPVNVPVASHEHEPLDGLHARECPQCRRRGAA